MTHYQPLTSEQLNQYLRRGRQERSASFTSALSFLSQWARHWFCFDNQQQGNHQQASQQAASPKQVACA